MAVVDQSCQRVASCLLTQMILQLALFGDVLSDDLIGVQLALLTHDFLSADADLQGCAVLSLAFYFDGIGQTLLARSPQQLRPLVSILNQGTHKDYGQEILF